MKRYLSSSILFLLVICATGFSQTFAEGEYYIQVAATKKYLAIENISINNGANLVQWDFANQDNHKFIIKKSGDGVTYFIMAKHSNRYLYCESSGQRDGSPVQQWGYVNMDHGKWYIIKNNIGDGYYIMNKSAQKRLRLRDGDYVTNNGMPLVISGQSPEQVFDFSTTSNLSGKKMVSNINNLSSNKPLDVQDGIYKIRINESGKYLAIAGQEDNNNGMRLIQWDMLPRNNHLFDIRRLDNGNYAIKAVHSQKVLDVVAMATDDGTQIQQWDNLNGSNQQWKFYTVNNGVSIVSVASGKKLQLSVGATNTTNGTPLIITSGGTQTFSLTPARAIKFTEYITFKNVRFTVPHGGDLDMFGEIKIILTDRLGHSYNRYYESDYNEETFSDHILFKRSEYHPIDMNKLRIADLGGEVKFKISSEELEGAKITIVYGINENDADVRAPGIAFGTPLRGSDKKDPDKEDIPDFDPHEDGGNDDFYLIKSFFDNCTKSKLSNNGYRNNQSFLITDIPASCLVHVNLQDEDGSDNWIDVFFTVTKERKFN
jgi:Ricin-type beta-trefoil lectin domain-like